MPKNHSIALQLQQTKGEKVYTKGIYFIALCRFKSVFSSVKHMYANFEKYKISFVFVNKV